MVLVGPCWSLLVGYWWEPLQGRGDEAAAWFALRNTTTTVDLMGFWWGCKFGENWVLYRVSGVGCGCLVGLVCVYVCVLIVCFCVVLV